MTDASTTQVFLRCIKQGSKLRVRILSPGYFNDANCQFPRAIREEGRIYVVEPRCIRLANGFYRVSQPIKIWNEEEDDTLPDQILKQVKEEEEYEAKGKRGKKRARTVVQPKTIFDHDDEPDCVICLEAQKERICVPCGHYCMCEACLNQLVKPRKCPMCREPIMSTLLPSEVK